MAHEDRTPHQPPDGRCDGLAPDALLRVRHRLAALRPDFGAALTNSRPRPSSEQHLENEFPHGPNDPHDSKFDRREILKVMAASAAFAGLTGCTKLPTQKILPYVRQPEEIVPGKALFYATAMTLGGIATGLLAESNMARPTKIEGNPDHPGESGRHRRVRAGRRAFPLRSGPLAHRHPRRAHRELERIPAPKLARARGTAGQARRRNAHFDRVHHFSDRLARKCRHCSRSFRKPAGINTNL